jgi:hypothetical protein
VWRLRGIGVNDGGQPILRAYVSPLVEYSYNENRFDESRLRLDTKRASLRAEAELRPIDALGLVVGTDSNVGMFHNVTDVPQAFPDERLFPRPQTSDPPRLVLNDDVLATACAVYVEADLRIAEVLRIVTGLRADLWSYYDELRTSFDPRFSVRYDVTRFVTLKGNLGLYHQAPQPFELAKRVGNPDLPLERGWQYGLGVELWLTRSLDVDVQAFLRTADHVASLVVSPLSFFAAGGPRVQPVDEERAYGVEVLLRQRLDHGFFGWIAYTIMRSEFRSDAAVGVPGSKPQPWFSTGFDQTHILSIALSYELPWGFTAGGAFRAIRGNPSTFAVGGVVDGDTGYHRRVNGPWRNDRLPPFVQLDARVDKKFVFDTWSLSAYLDVQNATNQQNFELFSYNFDFTKVQGFPGLPIIPVLGLEAAF